MRTGPLLCVAILTVAAFGANPALAQGDADAGKKVFKRCLVCHTLEEGKHKTGPSLHNILGQTAGRVKGFKYSPAYVQAGDKGLVWDEATLFQYLRHPSKFLRGFLEDPKARSRMVMKYRKEQDRRNVIEYMKSLGE